MVGGRSVCCYPIETERQRQTCKGLILIIDVHIVISTNQQDAQKSVSGTPGFEKKKVITEQLKLHHVQKTPIINDGTDQ